MHRRHGCHATRCRGELGRHATTCSALPHGLANDLNKCSWPNRMQERDSNALDDLAPTYCLLLELVDIKLRRRDWNDVLALIHLMSEYLGLLVWQSTLSHGGRPNLLASRFSVSGFAATHAGAVRAR